MPAKKYLRKKAKKLCLLGQMVIKGLYNIDRTSSPIGVLDHNSEK